MGIIRTDCDYRKQSTPNGVGTPPLFNGKKMNFYWGGMSPQPPPCYFWEVKSNQNPFWGVPFPASQWAALSAVQSEIELLNTPLLLLNRKKSQDFFRRGEAAKSSRAVVLTAANRFELASTMAPSGGLLCTNSCPLIFAFARSEVGGATIESTAEKIIKLCAIETQSLI